MKKQILHPDFCVVGAGSGGLSFAAGAVQMGASVVLLEANKMGGDCLNYGCVPSKALIAASKFGDITSRGKAFGWSFSKPSLDFQKVHKHVHSVIKNIAPNDSVERFEKLGVKVILEEGSFVDHKTMETNNYQIKAKRYILATGSSPFIPPIPGLDKVNFYTNETIFDLKELPKHLVIIGGGPIGVELAHSFVRFGCDVTILEAFKALPKDDPAATTQLKMILSNQGLKLFENIKIEGIQKWSKGVLIKCKGPDDKHFEIIASHLLVATGRRANTASLNLNAAGIHATPKGVEVTKYLQTSNKKVYAIGDCTGGYQFTHVAGYHAGLAIRNSIFGLRTALETRAIPWVTYTDPELAHVGLTEEMASDQNIPFKVLQMDFKENDRAQAEGDTQGFIKVLVSPKGQVLGATILGKHAGELIYPWVMIIQNKLKLTALTGSMAPYPTLNELSKRVAGSFYTYKVFSTTMRQIVGFIMKYFKG